MQAAKRDGRVHRDAAQPEGVGLERQTNRMLAAT